MAGAAAGLSAAVLGQRLSRSAGQVRARRGVLLGRKPAGLPYLPDEDEAIRVCLGHGGDLVALAHRLGRSPDALRLHARHLGLHHPQPRRRWAEWEDAVVRDGYTSALPCAEIARQLPQRTTTSVAARARKLGLISYARRWSRDDDQRLMRLTARGTTLEEAAQRLGRTPEAIRRRAWRLAIEPPAPASALRHARRWTREEDELLRLHHALNPARLAELLGRSDGAVCRRLCAIGLRARAQRSPHHPGNGPVARAGARRSAKPRPSVIGSPRRFIQAGTS
jgi:transposase-like protein